MLEVVDGGMLEVVSGGVTGFCREFTCADSTASCRVIFFKSACWVAEFCVSDANTTAFAPATTECPSARRVG
jgi:hypothetical protein